MARYRMDDDRLVNTEKATASWEEDTRWDGRNNISVATGSQWEHQTLYQSSQDRFYVECTSQHEGSTPHARWLSQEAAAIWLLLNGHDLPPLLEDYRDRVEE